MVIGGTFGRVPGWANQAWGEMRDTVFTDQALIIFMSNIALAGYCFDKCF